MTLKSILVYTLCLRSLISWAHEAAQPPSSPHVPGSSQGVAAPSQLEELNIKAVLPPIMSLAVIFTDDLSSNISHYYINPKTKRRMGQQKQKALEKVFLTKLTEDNMNRELSVTYTNPVPEQDAARESMETESSVEFPTNLIIKVNPYFYKKISFSSNVPIHLGTSAETPEEGVAGLEGEGDKELDTIEINAPDSNIDIRGALLPLKKVIIQHTSGTVTFYKSLTSFLEIRGTPSKVVVSKSNFLQSLFVETPNERVISQCTGREFKFNFKFTGGATLSQCKFEEYRLFN